MRKTMRKGVSLLLTAVMLLSLCPLPRVRAEETTESGTGETEVVWTKEPNKLIVDSRSNASRQYIDSSFNSSIGYSDNGYFLVTFEVSGSGSDSFVATNSLGFAMQIGDSWNWYGSSGATQADGETTAVKYAANSFTYSGTQWSADSGAIQAINVSLYGSNDVAVSLEKIEYFQDTGNTPSATLTISDADAKLPIDDMTDQYDITDTDNGNSSILAKDPEKKGFFRVTYKDENDSIASTVGLQRYTSDWSYIDDVSETAQDGSDGTKYIDFSGGTVLADGSSGQTVGRVAVKVNSGKVKVQKIEYFAPKQTASSVTGPWENNSGWGGLEPTFTINEENAVTFSVNDTTSGTDWRKVVIQKTLSDSNVGVGSVTLNCTEDIGFFVQLSGTVNDTQRDYYADGTKDNGTVTFSAFKYKVNDVETEATADDLAAFTPTGILIQVGSSSTLPSAIALSDITIVAPESSSVTGPWSNNSGWGGLEPTFTVNVENAVTFTVNDAGGNGSKVVIQKSLSDVSNIGSVTLKYTGDTTGLSFTAYFNGNDASSGWKQYSASGTYNNGTVTFSGFKDDSDESMPTTYYPSTLMFDIGRGATSPTQIAFSEITIVAPESGEPDDSGYTVKVTLSNTDTEIASSQTATIVTLSEKADLFKPGMITESGKFRVTCSGSNQVEFVLQDQNWSWKATSKEASNGIVEFGYDDLKTAWGSEDFSGLAYITIKNGSSSETMTVTKLEWLGNTPFSSDDELVSTTIFEGTATVTKGGTDTAKLLDIPAGKASAFVEGGKFRITYTGEDNLQLVLSNPWTQVEGTTGTTGNQKYLEFTYATCLAKWKENSTSATNLSGVTSIQVKNTNYDDSVTNSSATITKLEWLGPEAIDLSGGGSGEDPDPPTPSGGELTKDENGVVTIPAFEQQQNLDFTGWIIPGGYFRVEYTLNSGISDAGVALVINESPWTTLGDSSVDKDGNVRHGQENGVYYSEFTYADCLAMRGSDFNGIMRIFPQYKDGWKSPDADEFKAAVASYTIKYYPVDTKTAYSLNENVAVIGRTSLTPSGVTGSSYQWYRVVGNASSGGAAISGAASASYTPTEADKGFWIYCVIDGNIVAGPAAVVVSTTPKTMVLFEGSETLDTGDSKSATLWPMDGITSEFNKAMVVPGGYFRLTCSPASNSVKLLLQTDRWEWNPITGTANDGTVTYDFDSALAVWKTNFNALAHITALNDGSSDITITKLEWVGPDIGVAEAPYVPTDLLPFGGSTWEKDWAVTQSVTQDEARNLLTVKAEFDGGEWSKARMKTHSDNGFKVDDSDMISMNVYLEKSAMDVGGGEMLLQLVSIVDGSDKDLTGEFRLNTSSGETDDGETGETVVIVNGTAYYRTALNISISAFPERLHDFILAIRGKNSTFNGTILIENMIVRKYEGEKAIPVLNGPQTLTDNRPVEVAISSSNPSAFYGDAVKVAIRLAQQPASDVTVTSVLNKDQKTKSSITISKDKFKWVMTGSTAGGWEAETEIPVPCTVGEVETVTITVTGGNGGNMELTGLWIVNKESVTSPVSDGGGGDDFGGGGGSGLITLPYTWKFTSQIINPWKYEPGWNSNYSGGSSTKVTYNNGRMEVYVNYHWDGDQNWSQMAVTLWHDRGMAIKNATHVYLDLYYLPDRLDGSLTMKLNSGGAKIDTEGVIDWDNAKTVKIDGQTYNKVRVDFTFPPVTAMTVHDMALCIIGRNTTYRGPLLIEAMTIEEAYAGTFVWASQYVKKANSALRLRNGELVTSSGETIALPSQVALADEHASAAARSVYAYLQAIGASKDVPFGQQYNFSQKAGATNLSDSDTYDMVNDYAAVFGLDGLALAGAEFSASRCNQLYGTPFPSTAEGNVVAAAYLTNKAIERGAIVTLSCHMPNFSQVKTITPNCSANYAKYDFGTYTPNVLTGDTANEILPGGKYHEAFTAYLDMIADYANRVNGAVLFRPFHENTGDWFWWGASSCNAETYKNIYRYTVEYLRDEKNVHNFLYVYGPGSEAKTLADYGERYPGDGYVDLVGFDMYNWNPDIEGTWMDEFRQELTLVSQFAETHGKLVAVTETGAANETVEGDKQTALLRSGNKDLDWYKRVQEVISDTPASYFLLWANFGKDNGFYTPYVMLAEGRELYGHEMMKYFINYYNDVHSVFASDQKAVLSTLIPVTANAADGSSSFLDVSSNAYYAPAVQWALARGITSGISANTFSPDSSCTRAQVVTFLWRCAGSPAPNSQNNPFRDIQEDAYYYQAVLWAVEQGITSGTSANTFSPDSSCTRAQVVTFLWRSADSPVPNSQDKPFLDVQEDAFYCQAVLWATELGITAGTTATTFSPDNSCNRAQVVTFLYRDQQVASS